MRHAVLKYSPKASKPVAARIDVPPSSAYGSTYHRVVNSLCAAVVLAPVLCTAYSALSLG